MLISEQRRKYFLYSFSVSNTKLRFSCGFQITYSHFQFSSPTSDFSKFFTFLQNSSKEMYFLASPRSKPKVIDTVRHCLLNVYTYFFDSVVRHVFFSNLTNTFLDSARSLNLVLYVLRGIAFPSLYVYRPVYKPLIFKSVRSCRWKLIANVFSKFSGSINVLGKKHGVFQAFWCTRLEKLKDIAFLSLYVYSVVYKPLTYKSVRSCQCKLITSVLSKFSTSTNVLGKKHVVFRALYSKALLIQASTFTNPFTSL